MKESEFKSFNMDCAINSFNFCEAVRKREGKLYKESALFAHLCMLKDTFGETFEAALIEYLKGGGQVEKG